MSPDWNESKALKTVKKLKDTEVCDVLMNQEIFSGVGNIIKNEVLFRIKVHPECLVESLPLKKIKELVKEGHNYSHEFYHWKKAYVLKKNFLIYKKSECPRCKLKTKRKYLGKGKRLTCYCENCQVMYE
jgi:endonuclease-8